MGKLSLFSENVTESSASRCPLCGYRFSFDEMPERGCRICPMKRNCDALICPNCGYCQPQTTQVEFLLRRLIEWVRRTVGPGRQTPENSEQVRLRDLKCMSWARVKEVKSQSPDTVARLAGMCILPGVVFQLRQRQPAFVLRVDETMLALDRLLAEWIWVEPIGDLPTGDLDISAHQREDILLQPSITVSRLNGRNTKPH